jgi:hypothetical protein
MPFEPATRICPVCLTSFHRYTSTIYCSIVCSNKARKVQTTAEVRQYLLDRVTIPDDPDACWLWHAGLDDRGYPYVCVRGRAYRGHRIAYEIFCGPIPPHAHVLHSRQCLSRACINPRHLRAGSNRENMEDRNAMLRQARGSRAGSARLREKDVACILVAYHEESQSIKSLATTYNISTTAIHKIIYRKSWMHVLPDRYPAPIPHPRRQRTHDDARSKINADDVRLIRLMHVEGHDLGTIARRFSIHQSHAWSIIKHQAWKHIP